MLIAQYLSINGAHLYSLQSKKSIFTVQVPSVHFFQIRERTERNYEAEIFCCCYMLPERSCV